jgi:hypothetical protein
MLPAPAEVPAYTNSSLWYLSNKYIVKGSPRMEMSNVIDLLL